MQPRRVDSPRVFLLSPAHCGGKRAALLLRDAADFPLAVRLRSAEGISLWEAFSFLSGLYFRGKLVYASRFARPPAGATGVQVITANRGLVPADAKVGLEDLRAFGSVDIQAEDPRYREPLVRDIARLAEDPTVELVLLGSVATGKNFLGRGDMSRGALLLRAAGEGRELVYQPAAGALPRVRPGKRGAANDGDERRGEGATYSEGQE